MPIKKSDLYAKLWASCDELRGGMDASQYKDYVLVMLFIKYVSDKYAGQHFAPVQIPRGAGFADMVALKGRADIGDQINKTIIRPLEDANHLTIKADFNDDALLGQGKEKVERLGNLIGIFESPELDFSKNRADGDDILGDAYEYLMRHFATESGKSKGQFYTPAEVSRVMAAVLGIAQARTTPNTTVYDPTCGSGSLLLKVADAAPTPVSVYGQEKDEVTSGLARILVPGEGNIGSIFHYVNGKFDVHQRVYAITQFSDAAYPLFVFFFIETFFGPHAMSNSVKATVDSLRLPTFLDFDVCHPPTVNEQQAIAQVLSDMDTALTTLEARLCKARDLKQALMQVLLTGRIRLLAPDTAEPTPAAA